MSLMLLLLMNASICASGKEVLSTKPGRVSLKVVSRPLADVLECLSETTGIEVVYDGVSAPRAPVSAAIQDVPISQALDRLLADQQLKYALAVDPKGKNGGVVIISAGKGDGRSGGATSAPAETPLPSDPEGAVPTEQAPTPAASPSPAGTPTALPMLIGDVPQLPGISIPGVTKIPAPPSGPSSAPPPAPVFPEPSSVTRTTR